MPSTRLSRIGAPRTAASAPIASLLTHTEGILYWWNNKRSVSQNRPSPDHCQAKAVVSIQAICTTCRAHRRAAQQTEGYFPAKQGSPSGGRRSEAQGPGTKAPYRKMPTAGLCDSASEAVGVAPTRRHAPRGAGCVSRLRGKVLTMPGFLQA